MLAARTVSSGVGVSPAIRILGVDPGSQVTGFGVVDRIRGEIVLVEQGCIRAGRGDDFAARLRVIYEELCAVIARTSPSVVAVESPFHGLNAKSVIQLAHARGVILLAAAVHQIPVAEYSPRSIKSAVVGYGAAEKSQVEKMVRLLVSGAAVGKLGADAADALAVAVCHAHTGGSAAHMRIRG